MKKIILILLALSLNFGSYSQITITTALPPSVALPGMLSGYGIIPFNVTFQGLQQFGLFYNGTAGTGLDHGIALATGFVTDIPNHVSVFMSENLGLAGDTDIELFLGGGVPTYDAAVLEFDFIIIGDTLSFNYVFGSEEYPEYVCSNFNDAFGFFISGPGINGAFSNNAENICMIPGTTLPVSINSINPGVPGPYGTTGGCTSVAYSSLFVNNIALGSSLVCLDGQTAPLLTAKPLNAYTVYHAKIVVADAGDGIYDSGVLLEANYSYPPSTLFSLVTGTKSNVINESCDSVILRFDIGAPSSDSTLIVFTVSGTATAGVDYQALPMYIMVPPGSAQYDLPVYLLQDAVSEPNETIVISLMRPDGAYTQQLVITENGGTPLIDAGEDWSVCTGDTILLNANAAGAIQWSPVVSQGVPFVPATSGWYFASTYNGTCTSSDSLYVEVIDMIAPQISQSGDTLFSNHLSGNQWYDAGGNPIPGETGQWLIITSSGNYSLSVTDGGCTMSSGIYAALLHSPSQEINPFSLFPQPATDEINLVLTAGSDLPLEICLFNMSGKKVRSWILAPGECEMKLPVKGLPVGSYLFCVSNNSCATVVIK
jgi:hypothetical protein